MSDQSIRIMEKHQRLSLLQRVDEAEEAERNHFMTVMSAFASYRFDTLYCMIGPRRRSVRQLPDNHFKMLTELGIEDIFVEAEKCIKHNQCMINSLLDADSISDLFVNARDTYSSLDERARSDLNHIFKTNVTTDPSLETLNGQHVPPFRRCRTKAEDMDKVKSTLKQIVREWSSLAADERNLCYTPIIDEIHNVFADKLDAAASIDATSAGIHVNDETAIQPTLRVLVPGAGLGRLAFEIARLAPRMDVQGNEFSLFMLLISNFIMNGTSASLGGLGVDGYHIYPWVHTWTNVVDTADMMRAAHFPDVDPARLPAGCKLSMAAGDFVEAYSTDEYIAHFDCIVTCFFVDCAHNVGQFIDLIHRTLKPDGRWINLGPLLYHFADMPGELSIDLPYNVLRQLILRSGFAFEREKYGRKQGGLSTLYCDNPQSMMSYRYTSVFFTCVKTGRSDDRGDANTGNTDTATVDD